MTQSDPIAIETLVAFPLETAWVAFNTPEAITQWNQAGRGWRQARRALAAMITMQKIDVAAVDAARRG